MATPTYDLLDSTTLGTSATSVTLSGISGSYGDLILVVDGTTSLVTNQDLQFNSDTGSNYSYVIASGDGSSASSSTATTTYIRAGRMTTTQSNQIIQIMDYSATDKHTTTLSRANADEVRMIAGRWADTSAVTSLTISAAPSPRTYDAGTTFYLYGVAK